MFRKVTAIIAVLLICSFNTSYLVTTQAYAASDKDLVSIDMRNVDIRDVLSAIAVNMNKKIIYASDPMNVDFSIQDAEPKTALEYLLKTYGLDYLEDGNILLIGTTDDLSRYFYDKMSLTRFGLQYVASDVISSQISQLGIPVRTITLEANKKAIWVYGLPQGLGMVSDLIAMIDKPENAAAEQTSVPAGELLLTPVTLKYINGYQMNEIIGQMGLKTGIVLDSNPMTLWVYGDSKSISKIQEIQKKVDISDNSKKTNIILTTVKLNYLTVDEVMPILYEMASGVNVINFERRYQTFWLYGTQESINQAVDIVKKFDVIENASDNIFFVHKLTNITAKELKSRFDKLDLPGVGIDYMDYPEFSKNVIVHCPADYKIFVVSHIRSLDVQTEKIKVPVDFSNVAAGMSRLTERRKLLSQLTGIPETSFIISSNVSRNDDPLYIMYLEETPENISKVKDYITYIDNALTNGLSN